MINMCLCVISKRMHGLMMLVLVLVMMVMVMMMMM